MDFSAEHLSALLRKRLDAMPQYREALELVIPNAHGNVWLVGGIVSRLLIDEIYGVKQSGFDFDFLVDGFTENPVAGWTAGRRKHGNPTFTKDGIEVDIFPIATHDYIKSNDLEPTLRNFFDGVPFTIQAIAFDIATQQVIGDVGIAALQAKEYRVNNEEQAREMVEAKGIKLNDRIKAKADSLGLKPIFID